MQTDDHSWTDGRGNYNVLPGGYIVGKIIFICETCKLEKAINYAEYITYVNYRMVIKDKAKIFENEPSCKEISFLNLLT